MLDERVHYLYGLFDPQTSQLHYLGYTWHPRWRLYGHLKAAKNGTPSPVATWIRTLLELNTRPELRVLCVVHDQAEAKRIEVEYLARLRVRGVKLINTTGEPSVVAVAEKNSLTFNTVPKKREPSFEERVNRIKCNSCRRRLLLGLPPLHRSHNPFVSLYGLETTDFNA